MGASPSTFRWLQSRCLWNEVPPKCSSAHQWKQCLKYGFGPGILLATPCLFPQHSAEWWLLFAQYLCSYAIHQATTDTVLLGIHFGIRRIINRENDEERAFLDIETIDSAVPSSFWLNCSLPVSFSTFESLHWTPSSSYFSSCSGVLSHFQILNNIIK